MQTQHNRKEADSRNWPAAGTSSRFPGGTRDTRYCLTHKAKYAGSNDYTLSCAPRKQSSCLVAIASILLGLVFWFIEAAMHVFIFHEGPYVKQLLFPENHEIWMRLLGVCLIAAFGAYAQFMITRHRRAECRIKSAYGELEQIFNTAADGMRLIDKNFNVIEINDTFADLAGVNREEAVGKKCYEIFSGPMCHTSQCSLCRILSGNKRIECVVQKKRRGNFVIPCILTATPFRGIDGELIGIVEDFKDITEHKKAEENLERLNTELMESNKKLKTLVLIDPHTGLYNYRYLGEAIEMEFYRAKREGLTLSVIMMDIDYFKSINDVYGHQFGDLVLKQVAEQLKRVVRRYDIVIRFGGEEFIVISPNTSKFTALILGQRLLNAVSSNSQFDPAIVKVFLNILQQENPQLLQVLE